MNDIMNAKVFGADAKMHPITGMPIEQGHGALHPDAQAIGHWGLLQYQLAELTQRRKDHASDLQGKITERSNVAIADTVRARAGIVTGGNIALELANLDTTIRNMQGRTSALAAEHEAAAVKIAEVHAKLTEEGIFDKFGIGPATSWLGMIASRGWNNPS